MEQHEFEALKAYLDERLEVLKEHGLVNVNAGLEENAERRHREWLSHSRKLHTWSIILALAQFATFLFLIFSR